MKRESRGWEVQAEALGPWLVRGSEGRSPSADFCRNAPELSTLRTCEKWFWEKETA